MAFEEAKFNLVEQQIRTWNVLDPNILGALGSIDRENFVLERYRECAFADMNIPIGDGQIMLQPNVEARMLQALNPQLHHQALEIGAGSGHTAALLAYLVQHVDTIEIRPSMVALAKQNLLNNGVVNVSVHQADAAAGWNSDSKYNCIMFSGAVGEIPNSYQELLAIGGRMVLVVGQEPIMNAVLIERVGQSVWETSYLFETVLPHLDNFQKTPEFVF